MATMDWKSLLKTERQNKPTDVTDPRTDFLTPFEIGAERITYTSVFRRLQGKTQVYPLPIYDYLRTRLTHTNEVANVGRHLATLIAKKIESEKGVQVEPAKVSGIVYAACLAHDLGNPPFGHSGEEAIRDWFEKEKDRKEFAEVLSDDEKNVTFFILTVTLRDFG